MFIAIDKNRSINSNYVLMLVQKEAGIGRSEELLEISMLGGITINVSESEAGKPLLNLWQQIVGSQLKR